MDSKKRSMIINQLHAAQAANAARIATLKLNEANKRSQIASLRMEAARFLSTAELLTSEAEGYRMQIESEKMEMAKVEHERALLIEQHWAEKAGAKQ